MKRDLPLFLAEREGFEPSVATRTTAVFETAPFNHSGTSPVERIVNSLYVRAKLYLRIQRCYTIISLEAVSSPPSPAARAL